MIYQQVWQLYESGDRYDEFVGTKAQAIEAAKSGVSRANYPDAEGTIRVDWMVRCKDTGEEAEGQVTLYPPEPVCSSADGHDWQSPHEVVGGLRENPGVTGHGGGVIVREVCACCGMYRVTDTWATDPTTGQPGESVAFEPADETSREWAQCRA